MSYELTVKKQDCFQNGKEILCDCGMYTILLKTNSSLESLPDEFTVEVLEPVDNGLYLAKLKDEEIDLSLLFTLPEFKIFTFRGSIVKIVKKQKQVIGYRVKTKFFTAFLPVKRSLQEHKVGDQVYVKVLPSERLVVAEVHKPSQPQVSKKVYKLTNIVNNKAIYYNPLESKQIDLRVLYKKYNRIPYTLNESV